MALPMKFSLSIAAAIALFAAALPGCGDGNTTNTGGAAPGGSGGAGGNTGGTGGTGGGDCIAAEICGDGIDNDCNGEADDSCTDCKPGDMVTCYSGPTGTEDVGQCASGLMTCGADGTYGPCEGDTLPGEELCDGVDNDCNGEIDNDPTDIGGGCDTGLAGACATGTYGCEAGEIVCVADLDPTEELCDGLDNDCNGTIDDATVDTGSACDTGLLGVCAAGTDTCVNGLTECIQNVMPTDEVCDNVDNNCDGAVDENDPGGGGTCDTGLEGVCVQGLEQCQNGALVCIQVGMPSPESCDAVDNDCNGMVDDGDPGGGMACNTGLAGECAAGTTSCTAGAITCNQNSMASAETCDGLDNDCDGTVDNGNPGGGAPCSTGLVGVCATGTEQCTGGAIVCAPDTPPVAETCDGVDNDCDDLIDDGPNALSIYFYEDFNDNGAGWTTAGQWAIGATSVSTGQTYGNPDPANDHTSTNDNGVAGVYLGGNVGSGVTIGPKFLTSPVIDTSGATGSLYLSFWRWLNSDYLPYMVNQVQVYDGAAWNTVFQTSVNPGIQDIAWSKQQYDITAYKSATMQVRFGYNVNSNASIVSGWNIDDVIISNSPYPNVRLVDEFSDTSQSWTLGTSWAIGATSVSSGQTFGHPDPTNDHTLGTNNGVMGVILGGNAPENHPYYYATSKVMDTAWDDQVQLRFWRWLNSDYSPHMVNQVQVYNGTAWQILYQTDGSPGVQDNAWTNMSFDLTPHLNADMQIRIGYTATSGAHTVSSWNVDDLFVTSGTVCQ